MKDTMMRTPVFRPRAASDAGRCVLRAAAALMAAAAILIAAGCGADPPEERTVQAPGDDHFTFFELGAHSTYSEAVRRRLRDQLGNEAISRRSIINLETTAPGFLAAHVPELDALNRRLNDPPGQRVDHEVVKLMYRYARQRNVPFDYVELLFAEISQKPILFHIRFKADEAGTVEALQRRHGDPQVIDWGSAGGQSLIWRREGEWLIVSRVPDRLGEIGHRVSFYFTANIEEMLDAEQEQRERRARERQQTGRTAF
jgi:hypothetical protein